MLTPPVSRGTYPWVAAAAFSGDGTTVAIASALCTDFVTNDQRWGTGVWRVATRAPVLRLPAASGYRVALDRTGSILAVEDRTWRTATGEQLRGLGGAYAFADDDRRALVARRGRIRIVGVPSGAVLATLDEPSPKAEDTSPFAAAFSHDGERLVTKRNGTVRLWDAESGRRVADLGKAATSAAFGAGGRLVLVVYERRLASYRASDGSPVVSVARTGRQNAAAISPDGKLAAEARDDGSLDLVELQTGDAVRLQTETSESLTTVSFLPGREALVVGDRTGAAHLVRCPVCADDDVLLARARARAERLSRLVARRPA